MFRFDCRGRPYLDMSFKYEWVTEEDLPSDLREFSNACIVKTNKLCLTGRPINTSIFEEAEVVYD